jgi:hypothetical protein
MRWKESSFLAGGAVNRAIGRLFDAGRQWPHSSQLAATPAIR